jgi:hypothetical protein
LNKLEGGKMIKILFILNSHGKDLFYRQEHGDSTGDIVYSFEERIRKILNWDIKHRISFTFLEAFKTCNEAPFQIEISVFSTPRISFIQGVEITHSLIKEMKSLFGKNLETSICFRSEDLYFSHVG